MDETKKLFTPPPRANTAPDKRTPTGIFACTTSNYEAMKKFFSELGFNVREEPRDQLVPLFNQGRGSYVSWGDVAFNLEESTTGPAKAAFNVWVLGCSPEDIGRMKTSGHHFQDSGPTLWGREYTFVSPDGGRVVIHDEGEGMRARLLTMLEGAKADCA